MATEYFFNNAYTYLSADHNIADGALTVNDSAPFSGGVPFRVTVGTTIYWITAVTGNVLTIDSAIEGTVDTFYPTGTTVIQKITAGMLADAGGGNGEETITLTIDTTNLSTTGEAIANLQVKDATGTNVSAIRNIKVWLSDTADGALVATALTSAPTAANGIILNEIVTNKLLDCLTDATGLLSISLINTTSKTAYLVAAYLEKLVTASITWTATNIHDSFTRVNNSGSLGNTDTGQTWSVTGTWGITSNTAQKFASNFTVNTAYVTWGSPDMTVIGHLPSTGSDAAGICGRRVDDSNFWALWYNIYAGGWFLRKWVGGSATDTALPATGLSAPWILKLEFTGNTIKAYINNVLQATVTDAALNTATKAGIVAYNTNATSFTYFEVG